MRIAAIVISLVIGGGTTCASASVWPDLKPGESIEMKGVKALPEGVRSLPRFLDCALSPDKLGCDSIHVQFAKLTDGRDIALISFSDMSERTMLFQRYADGSMQELHLAIGNPKHGYVVTKDFGSLKLDSRRGTLDLVFAYDVLGKNVWYDEFKYESLNGDFTLVEQLQVNSMSGKRRSVWRIGASRTQNWSHEK